MVSLLVLWTAIPIVLLLPLFTFGSVWFFDRSLDAEELPVERAYRAAMAARPLGREPGRLAERTA